MADISELQIQNATLLRRISELENQLAQNFSEKLLIEKTFQANDGQFLLPINDLLEGFQLISFEWRYLYINETAARQAHHAPNELLNHTMMEVYPGIESTALFKVMCDCMTNRTPKRVENQFTFSDGSFGWFELSIQPAKQGILVLSTDINKRNQAEEALRESEARFLRDISERKSADEKIRQSEEQYRYLFENNPHPMWAYDLKTLAFLAVNEAAIEKYGYSREEFLKMTIADIRPPDDLERLKGNLKQSRPALQHSGEWRHSLKNGTIIDVEISSHTLVIGDRDAALVVARDITERKQAEIELRENTEDLALINTINEIVNHGEGLEVLVKMLQKEFKPMFSSRGVSLYLLSQDGKTLNMPGFSIPQDLKEKLEKLIGRSISSPTFSIRPEGIFYKQLHTPGGTIITDAREVQQVLTEFVETARIPANLKALLSKMIPQIYQFLSIRSIITLPLDLAGTTVGLLGTSSTKILGAHELKRIQKIGGQLTAAILRKRDEDALRTSNERFEQITNHIHEVFWMFDQTQQQMNYVSPAYETIWGRTIESLMQNPRELIENILPEDRPIMFAAFKRQAQGLNSEVEYRIQRPDGLIRWIWDRSFPIMDETGKLVRAAGVATDITERKQTENEAFQRQKLLEKVIQLGKNITAITDLQACLLEIHRSITQGLGFDRVGLFMYDARTNFIRGALGTSRTGQIEDYSWYLESAQNWSAWEVTLKSPTGMAVMDNFQATHNPPPDHEMYGVKQHVTLAAWAGDQPVAMITVDNLVTQRTITPVYLDALQLFAGYAGLAIENARLNAGLEQRVKERTAEVQDLYDNAPAGYHSIDKNGTFVLVNQTELNWLGYTREELVGIKTLLDITTPKGQQIFKENFPILKKQGWLKNLELELIRKDKSILPVLLNASAIYAENGDFLMSRSTIFDLTERKKTEQALREGEEQNRLLFEESPDAIALLDGSGKIIRANHAYEQLTKIPVAKMLGFSAENLGLITTETFNNLFESVEQATARQENFTTAEYILHCADGSSRNAESRIFLLKIGGVDHILITTRDISTHKKAEETLRLANNELEQVMRMKDEFLASMSHELRTPLTSVLGLSEALQMNTYGVLNEKQLKAINNIETSGRHLLDLINDILDLSKIEAGKLDLQFEPCGLVDICQASLQLTKGMAYQKHQTVKFSANQASVIIQADPRRLKQMLVNLLSNAIKFTPDAGELGLDVQLLESKYIVRITVWDKGPGIRKEDLPRLFKPFVQLDSSLSRHYSGTGLGLSLVQKMAELHSGSVQVESVPGEGSRFTIVLPWITNATRPLPVIPFMDADLRTEVARGSVFVDDANQINGITTQNTWPVVLVVDDNQVILEIISDFLKTQKYRVTVANSSQKVLELGSIIHPDLILMDIQMPGINGLETIQRIRANQDTRLSKTVIIAITALTMPGDREQCLEAGANEYLSKPLELKNLIEVINEQLAKRNL